MQFAGSYVMQVRWLQSVWRPQQCASRLGVPGGARLPSTARKRYPPSLLCMTTEKEPHADCSCSHQ